ncbi:MAG: hypothetical protein E7289_03420 [Lachnospiraceae bacterium]|nr:hypothetical protein [Lachnospiraceae bacterium]
MRQLKKTVVLAVLAVVMTMMVSVSVKAGRINTPTNVVWGQSFSGYVTAGDYYEYNLVLPKPGKVTLLLNQSGDGNVRMRIFDSANTRLLNYVVNNGTQSYSFDLVEGTYSLVFEGYVGYQEFDFSCVPSFVPSNENIAEGYFNKNNDLGMATGYRVGSTMNGHFAVNDDKDIYKFKVSKAGYINVKVMPRMQRLSFDLNAVSGDISYSNNVATIGTNSYKFFVPKGTYYLTMEKGDGTGEYSFSMSLKGITTTKVKTAKNLKGKKAKISWSRKTNVDGYQVQVAQNKKFTKGKKSKTLAITTGWSAKNPTSYTFTKLKKGKYYYARVRTYKLANGKKYYSDWSAVKKFKVKK